MFNLVYLKIFTYFYSSIIKEATHEKPREIMEAIKEESSQENLTTPSQEIFTKTFLSPCVFVVFGVSMNKKVLVIAVVLIVVVSVGLVYAQQNGYFINISNSNANLNTSISNSTVVENVTLTNGTLNMQINADNISSVTINGVPYSAQQTPSASPSSANPQVLINYYGMNVGAPGVLALAGMISEEPNDNQTGQIICYTWNITMVNMNAGSPVGGSAVDQALAPLISKYPQLVTETIPEMWQDNLSQNNSLTLMHCCSAFGGNYDKCCFGLYANSPLSSDQINQLTQDLQTQLISVIINYYS